MSKPCRVRSGRASAIAGAVAALFAAPYASPLFANPVGGQVVSGNVNVSTSGPGQMNITQKTPSAIVNWNSFSIGSNEAVRIAQPSASSTLLNRVTGNNPSTIAGLLQANGKVFLVNPAGIIFAPGSSVNVGSLVASTLNISDADFLAGNYRFVGASTAAVSNAGALTAQPGGTIALLGATVSNSGTVSARLGTVAMGAGSDITVDFAGDGLTTLRIDQGAAGALLGNTGTLAADGGTVVMSAQTADALAGTVINQQGIVRAQSISEHDGHILLDGGTSGVTQVGGTLDATGGAGLTGGRIDVTGYDVALLGGARVDASGAAGGGTVRFGGGAGGADTDLRNANAIWMAPTASIHADALDDGNGGHVVAFSDTASRLYGTLSATGGPQGGNGGLIETSGHYLDTTGLVVDASAAKGQGGTWLLDPFDVDIEPGTPEGVPDSPLFGPYTGTTTILDGSINDELNAGVSVIVSSGTGGSILLDSGSFIHKSSGGDAVITLSAGGSLTLLGNIEADQNASAGKLGIVLEANQDGAAAGVASITNTAPAEEEIGTVSITLQTNGGNVSIGAGANGTTFDGSTISLNGVTINTTGIAPDANGDGSVAIHGMAPTNSTAVELGSNTAVTYSVTAGFVTTTTPTTITTSTGTIDIEGGLGVTPNVGGTTGYGGVALFGVALTTASGPIRIYGAGAGPTTDDEFNALGVDIEESTVSTTSGSIDIRGAYTGTGTPAQNEGGEGITAGIGVYIFDSTVQASGAGTSVSIAGSTDLPLPGVEITGDGEIPTLISAGAGGSVSLRALNDNSTASLVVDGPTALLGSTGGVLSVLPGGVDPDTFGFTSGDALPIGLFTTVAGMSIDEGTFFGQFQGFQTIVLGSTTQTGKITVGGAGCGGVATCTQEPVFNTNLTLANPAAGSQGISLLYGASFPGHTLVLSSGGSVTDPGGIQAAGLLLAGPGTFTLTDPQNAVGVLAMVGAGNVDFLNSGSFVIGPIVGSTFNSATSQVSTLDGTNSTLTGNLVATAATGNLGLGGGTASAGGPTGGLNTNLSAGGSIDLVMENGVFTDAGTGTLSAGDAWRVWGLTWNGETRGNVQPDTAQPNFYGCTFGSGCSWGGAVPTTGNHFMYVDRPTVTVTANGATRIAGAPNPAFTYTTSSLINGDTASGALTGSLSSPATQGSPPGQYAIDPAFASGVGYVVNDVPGTLTVIPMTDAVAQSGVQALFGSQQQTFVYENNLQGTNICIGSNQPVFTTEPPGDSQDLLAVEWKRVRSQPNLNSCMLTIGQHGCGDF